MRNNKSLVGASEMRDLAKVIEDKLPRDQGIGFALFVFPLNTDTGIGSYVSNGQRDDMIKFMEDTLSKFKSQQDFKTPEEN